MLDHNFLEEEHLLQIEAYFWQLNVSELRQQYICAKSSPINSLEPFKTCTHKT
jgi:hypothetical protein